ncbi:MAG: glutamate racemase [Chloroflexota bacterium]
MSVLREIRATLPHEHLLYVGDSAHAPYGDKSPEYVEKRSLTIAQFLNQQGAKAIVIASNTGTVGGATALRETYTMPVVAMEPAVKAAAMLTKSGVIGVLATLGTAASSRFASLLTRYKEGIEVITKPAPGLVEHIERGDLTGPETRKLVEQYVGPMVAGNADVIVLGSTHYVFLKPLIADVVGPGVVLVDTGAAVARQLQRVLQEQNLVSEGSGIGTEQFWTSSTDPAVSMVMSQLYGRHTEVQMLPKEYM